MWPVKTARWLADFSGLSPRAAYLTLAHETEPSGATLANLIRSDVGFAVIEELMNDEFGPPPAWWTDVQVGQRLVELERRSAANALAIDRLRRQIDGDRDTRT